MRQICLVLLLAAAPLVVAPGQGQSPNRMEIRLERLDDASWRTVDPGLVFGQDDRVRFRFQANFSGFLYVMNQGTSGQYTMLYPRQDTGEQNRIEPGQEYTVPSTNGSFRITGPAGQDVVYWMVTPLKLGSSSDGMGPVPAPLAPPPTRSSKTLSSLSPRCDDAIFRARGECVDSSAGIKAVPRSDKLPENLAGVPGAASRELLFIREREKSVISSPEPLKGPVIYEFRLAHR